MAFVKVASVNDIKPGEGKTMTANGKEIAMFNVGGEFFAIDNICAHRGGPLGEGMLDGNVVTCPWHGWRYDVKTGASAVMPNIKQKSFPVKLEGDDVLVEV